MLLTARICAEKGYSFALCCPRCRTLQVIYAGFAERVIAKGKGDRPLRAMFDAGLFVCSRHDLPADFMSITHDRDSTVDEIARWTRKGPAAEGGAS